MWTLTAGYALRQGKSGTVSVFAGVRYFDVDVATRWELTTAITVGPEEVILPAEGRIKAGTTLWDGVLGLRGELGMEAGKWSVPFYVDYGAGDSDRTRPGMYSSAWRGTSVGATSCWPTGTWNTIRTTTACYRTSASEVLWWVFASDSEFQRNSL